MSRGFVSFGPGGPRVGVVLGRKEAGKALALILVPFGVLALFGGATEHFGVLGFIAASALIALLWFAWTRPPGNGPLLSKKEADAMQVVANWASQAWCDWCNKRP
jgi:hypothetical protein